MKFNPITGQLWTNNGEFLKTLDCPSAATGRDVIMTENANFCRVCDKSIVNISAMDDESVSQLFKKNPEQCVSLSIETSNMEIVYNVADTQHSRKKNSNNPNRTDRKKY